ncbi:flagellin [Jeongeupia wiesaeckerbachi]|uniref:flagellin N-terminal helical domain-containing protein n=1 Tax=Jeongeupia wiesaeckerbachi TaxID=3051218 RepID=UPI003D8040C4
MAQVINTNVASLTSQRNLGTSQAGLNTSLQRLSSGLRINSAKDDAAGLAISQRMTSQIRGLDQANRNANDGVSLAQTAEGALSSAGDMLQRIRELAVQSSNATNSSSDRQAIQSEVGQLTSELDRIAKTTNFNGKNLLDGSFGTATFQVGANANQVIQASGVNFRTNNYGNNSVAVDQPAVGAATKTVAAQAVKINGSLGSATYTTTATDTAQSIAQQINAKSDQTGVSATASTSANLGLGAETYTLGITSDNTTAATVSFSVSGGATTADDYASAINSINAATSKTGVTAEFDAVNGGIKLTNASGNDIKVTNQAAAANTKLDVNSYDADGTTGAAAFDAKAAAAVAVANGRVTLDSANSFSVTDAGSGYGLTKASTLDTVASLDVTSFANSQKALKIVDSALAAVNGQRAQYGALQSRFESSIANLQTTSDNLSASRSRIQDTDFAKETATMTRNQVLQQAGTAMLAQANALPNQVLSLLRG